MWGHGVGMSASEALCQGNNGKVWDEIHYFYKDVAITALEIIKYPALCGSILSLFIFFNEFVYDLSDMFWMRDMFEMETAHQRSARGHCRS